MTEIEYRDDIIMETFQKEITENLGDKAWETLIKDIGVPVPQDEWRCGCNNMRIFMRRFDEITENDGLAKTVLTRVRHGLKHEQFSGAKEKFKNCGNNIDTFILREYQEQIELFRRLNAEGKDFYGQAITDEVLDFVLKQEGMLAPVRKGNELHISAFPYDMASYIKENDPVMKRFHACHCPYARNSVYTEEGAVSKTLCYCSLGHAKIMWDVILETELDGEVVSTVLGGDDRCGFVIYLPDDVIRKYT